MRISSVGYSTNFMKVAASRPQFEGRGSHTSPVKQIIEAGRAAASEQGKGSRIDIKA